MRSRRQRDAPTVPNRNVVSLTREKLRYFVNFESRGPRITLHLRQIRRTSCFDRATSIIPMTLDIRHIKHFVAVAEELHFARAAARVGIEQSPLSQSIRDLEGRLGVKLFYRTTCGTSLTLAGAALLADARRILGLVERIRRHAHAVASGRTGHLRVGLCTDLFTDRIAAILRLCREQFPNLEVSVTDIADSSMSMAHLRRGDTDVCFGSTRVEDPDIASMELGTESFVAWIPGSESKQLPSAMYVRRSTAAVLVESGLGIALVPASFTPSDSKSAKVEPVGGDVQPATVWAAYRRDDDAPAIGKLLELIELQRTLRTGEDWARGGV